MEFLFDAFGESSILDTSVIAYLDGESAGFITVASDDPGHALLESGRQLDDSEKLNFLGIGVREGFRGRGVNYAMAAYSFLELARRGWTHLSYTLVLDDNWASRRTGERLGCEVCANYLVYRRNF
jgi:GNAT superfamily N-acetyltransferase